MTLETFGLNVMTLLYNHILLVKYHSQHSLSLRRCTARGAHGRCRQTTGSLAGNLPLAQFMEGKREVFVM
jgi:hypothetical protein